MTYYVAHRLFALHDRALAALVADILARRVGSSSVFLPFADTDEEQLVSDCKGRHLFELDCRRLADLKGMIAILHGPSLDDGVCMEIGYARSVGAPVIVLTTDFQTYGLCTSGPEMAFPDPLIEAITQGVVRRDRLGSSSDGNNRYRQFMRRNIAPLTSAVRAAVDKLLSAVERPMPIQSSALTQSVFVERSPYCSNDWTIEIAGVLEKAGWHVDLSSRWAAGTNLSRDTMLKLAKRDWELLRRSNLLIVDVNGPEAPPGAAAMIGSFVSVGRRVLARHSSPSCTFAPGREPNYRNLMIQYGITARFDNSDELRELLSP